MTLNIAEVLTPKRKEDDGLDYRYSNHVRKIISITGTKSIQRLAEFYDKTSELEKNFSSDAFNLCLAFYQTEMNDWERKAIRSSLRELLKEIGFKPSKVSSLLGASELTSNLNSAFENASNRHNYKQEQKRIKEVIDLVDSLPISSKYIVSTMNSNGLTKAVERSKEKQWNKQTDTFDLIPITRKELQDIQRENPINEFEMRGRGSSNTKVLSSTNNSITQPEQQISSGSALLSSQGEAIEIPEFNDSLVVHKESTDIEHETIPPTQAELIQQLNLIANQIDTEEVFVNDVLRAQLEPFQHRYETLSELAKPRTSRPKYL